MGIIRWRGWTAPRAGLAICLVGAATLSLSPSPSRASNYVKVAKLRSRRAGSYLLSGDGQNVALGATVYVHTDAGWVKQAEVFQPKWGSPEDPSISYDGSTMVGSIGDYCGFDEAGPPVSPCEGPLIVRFQRSSGTWAFEGAQFMVGENGIYSESPEPVAVSGDGTRVMYSYPAFPNFDIEEPYPAQTVFPTGSRCCGGAMSAFYEKLALDYGGDAALAGETLYLETEPGMWTPASLPGPVKEITENGRTALVEGRLYDHVGETWQEEVGLPGYVVKVSGDGSTIVLPGTVIWRRNGLGWRKVGRITWSGAEAGGMSSSGKTLLTAGGVVFEEVP